jgi:hypothetical protein
VLFDAGKSCLLGGRCRTGRAGDRDGGRKRLALVAANDRKPSGSCIVTVTSRRLSRIARWE